MPESPQQWYARTSVQLDRDGYRNPEFEQWSSWPWTGTLTPRALQAPVDAEPERFGAGGVDCRSCASVQDPESGSCMWFDDLFVFAVPLEPRALPFALFLLPRSHADLADLTVAEAARQGELLTAIERAACEVLDIPRIQVARWGDGGEHLHWWLYARPTGMLQLRGTFLSHWDDLLPPAPIETFRADQLLVLGALADQVGGEVVEVR